MTMTPETFRELLDDGTAAAPPSPAPGQAAVEGRRRLRRRRVGAAAGGLQVAAAVAAGVASATASGPQLARDGAPVASDPPTSTTSLLESCREGNQSGRATGYIFDAGAPTVEASVRTDHQVELALQSADDRHWAECWVHLDDQEFSSGMTVYETAGRNPNGSSYGYGPGCGLVDGDVDSSCATFAVWLVDRLPEAVAAVRYDLSNGRSETVPSRNGYVVLNYLGPLPGGEAMGPDGLPSNFQPLTRTTYLDASGTAIAAEARDGSGTGPDRQRVDGLPLLKAYPSLRGEELY